MVVWVQNPFDNLPSEGYRKQRYWLMCEAFVRSGHQVVFWTSSFSHAKKKCRGLGGLEGLGGLGGLGGLEGLDVRLIPTRPYLKNICLARIRSHRAYAKEWLRLALDNRTIEHSEPSNIPALIITSTPTLSAAAAALTIGRALGSKVVVDVMDAWPETFERLVPKGLRWLARPFLSGMYRTARRLYREADLVTGVCERYRGLTGREDYYLAYHGIEGMRDAGREMGDAGRLAGSARKIRLVYAGNLGKTYDLATVVKAVEANPDFELDVAGYGKLAYDCPRVRFHGLLSEPDLQAVLERCDVGIVPMKADSWVGVPYKFCDYSRAGLAIVSSLGGESSALLEKHRCGATYDAGDVQSLTAAIRRAMTLERGASRTMCAAEFDARNIYDEYVARVTSPSPCARRSRG